MKAVFVSMTLISSLALGAAPIDFETSCRLKAKELAADTYRSCITENKTARIEKIRDEYQEEVRALKEKFEKKIGKLSGKQTASRKPRRTNKTTELPSTSTYSAAPVTEEVPVPNNIDESTMDIPEPIPVDNSNL